ncbi:beta-ketoacyl-ACP synthase III [Amycolatopsis rhabdoformis]|uniref:Beta-ketoacyl-[acyl-carrier-protein] synthase III n=1 Tax=Amycolatopsis rhabdoformis TaxID=1448059 RepID=A0ABZ1I8L0_9PSEU|nr:beta-ketoacyl-ACP synthase III [Amycolatopsis rhabdoformis]WSE30502.1 beta-ketoacyl-ACP synthase III [Amycolatopsis rhabdoformis]
MTDRPSLRLSTGPASTRILGVGSHQPEKVVTNDDLSQLMDTNDQWIRERVGIIERRFGSEDELLVDYAVAAGEAAMADAGVDPSEVDTVILPNCTMPTQIPNAAAQVAARLGIPSPGAFDLNAACAGFCYGLGVASDLVRAGSAKKVLVIGAEKLTDVVDPTDRANAIIFADGAGAAVVGGSDEPGIGPVVWGSAGDLVDLITMRDGKWIYQEGQSVFRWATTKIAPIAMRALEAAGLQPSDVDVLIPHQANLRIVESIAKKLKAAGAREDLVVADDIKYSGNTSSASIPLALDHMRKAGTAKPGDVVLAIGFGAGLSYAGQAFVCP